MFLLEIDIQIENNTLVLIGFGNDMEMDMINMLGRSKPSAITVQMLKGKIYLKG
jgi:hypothetical protein